MELRPEVLTELAEHRSGASMRVLIVDDSALIRRRLAERLEQVAGVEVVGEAEDGRQALEAIESARPHLLTLDIRMPSGNGLVLLKELQSLEHAPLVAVVSNYATSEYRSRCSALGALALFEKSSEIEDLMLLVETLERRSASREIVA